MCDNSVGVLLCAGQKPRGRRGIAEAVCGQWSLAVNVTGLSRAYANERGRFSGLLDKCVERNFWEGQRKRMHTKVVERSRHSVMSVMCGLFYCLSEGEIVGENNTYGRTSVIIIICVTKYLHTFSIMTF